MGYVPLELQNNYKKSITRAEFARLVVAAISFSAWAVSSIDFVTHRIDKKTNTPVMMGLDNLFNPKGNYTKEQAILTIYRLMNSLD